MRSKAFKILVVTAILSLSSCSKEEEITESRIDLSTPELTTTDLWIREHLTEPYNINVDYLFRDYEVATNRYLAPPEPEEVIPFLEAYIDFMIEPYKALAGEEFVKRYFSKQLVLVGSSNYNNDGTVFLGQAEGGVKVTLYEINYFSERTSGSASPEQIRAALRSYFKTLHHEFAHILQQNKIFDKESYRTITPIYRSSWFNLGTQQARDLGFISPYASLNENEDFAEMVAIMLTTSPEEFQAILQSPGNPQAQQDLQEKLSIILDYYKSSWNIDLFQLQENISEQFENYLNNA